MPQSSSIIGLLRFLILKNNLGLDCKDKQKIIVEIGKQGFVLKDSHSAKGQDFGRLKSVSPVFITDSDEALYTRLPMDYGYMEEKKKSIEQYESDTFITDERKKYEQYEYYRRSSIAKELYQREIRNNSVLSSQATCLEKEKKQTCKCKNCIRRKRSEHMRWNAYTRVIGYAYNNGVRADRACPGGL